eukprot:scaffold131982_cov16-Prasinocladus_malaysianus.AAC.1
MAHYKPLQVENPEALKFVLAGCLLVGMGGGRRPGSADSARPNHSGAEAVLLGKALLVKPTHGEYVSSISSLAFDSRSWHGD